jgi:diacylglycerol kinase family enzyme
MTAEANHYFNTAQGLFRKVKRVSTSTAILWAAIQSFFRYQKFQVRIRVESLPPYSANLVNLGIVKNAHFSGDFRYDQSELPDSGFFGVHLCEDMNKVQTLMILRNLLKGRFSGLPQTQSWRSSNVTVESERSFSIETDGELIQASQAQFSILPRELMLCP